MACCFCHDMPDPHELRLKQQLFTHIMTVLFGKIWAAWKKWADTVFVVLTKPAVNITASRTTLFNIMLFLPSSQFWTRRLSVDMCHCSLGRCMVWKKLLWPGGGNCLSLTLWWYERYAGADDGMNRRGKCGCFKGNVSCKHTHCVC